MIDPWTVTGLAAAVPAAARLAGAAADAWTVRARIRLVKAAAELPPGSEVGGSGRGGTWYVRVAGAREHVSGC
ncbi:hypothetical protein GA0074692_2440 [Micromonospora pallida]|uniref:Uncharacterized protein n=1 Tax=Micromonospora pallida TaxID=145854 RepID=A0A1C6SEV2_9ACTN|nr:hypothetical protein [Micromonospora pallida]SCL27923.1 hypothetical protein GA0074692_2440 [Micromonospora pallida]